MLIGVVCEHKGKKALPIAHMLRRSKIESLKFSQNPFELAVFELPCGEERLKRLSGARADKLLLKAAVRLQRSKTEAVVFSEAVKEHLLCGADRERIKNAEKELFFRAVAENAESLAKKCGIDILNSEVCISCRAMDKIGWYLSRAVCFKTKNLSLCTLQTPKFQTEYAEFCGEMGFYPRVAAYGGAAANRADIIIDVDGGFAEIGRSVKLSGVGFGFETGGICVDTADIAACIGAETAKKSGLYFKFGKNKLTLT